MADEKDDACAYLGVDLRAIMFGIVIPFSACCWRSSTPSASRSAERGEA